MAFVTQVAQCLHHGLVAAATAQPGKRAAPCDEKIRSRQRFTAREIRQCFAETVRVIPAPSLQREFDHLEVVLEIVVAYAPFRQETLGLPDNLSGLRVIAGRPDQHGSDGGPAIFRSGLPGNVECPAGIRCGAFEVALGQADLRSQSKRPRLEPPQAVTIREIQNAFDVIPGLGGLTPVDGDLRRTDTRLQNRPVVAGALAQIDTAQVCTFGPARSLQ